MSRRLLRVERPAGWSTSMPSRVACASLLLFGAVFLPASGVQPLSRRPTEPLRQAQRALTEGRYDDVEHLVSGLEPGDPDVAALRAQADIERGRYDQAEGALKPAASRAPASEAALTLGLLEQLLGRPDASTTLARVASLDARPSDVQGLLRAGRASRALGRYEDAKLLYNGAASAAPNDPAVNTAWGDMLAEKHNNAEAVQSFRAALQADQKWVPALVGLAGALEEDDPPSASAMARQALAVNPSCVPAHVFLARQAIDEGNATEAASEIDRALAVNPASLEAHALSAAIAYVQDRQADFSAEVAKVLAVAPRYADVYRVPAELTAHRYRFDEAVVLARKAMALDPKDARVLGDLGVDLLRTGDEPGAREVLDASFAADPYNVVTHNLLGMMDKLDTFVTLRDGDLVVRMEADEAPVLGEHAVALAHQALATLSARYAFTPRGPFLIEVFTKHDDFAVRNLGLPGMIGALGACFGRVVTMDSPRVVGRPSGDFQWEATLWHELTHVITLQMSNSRVPRWLTEGISVFEEKRARPEWTRAFDIEFASALNRNEAIKLSDLDAAFSDPTKIMLAYYEASLVVDHLVSTYGDAGLQRLLRAYGTGVETEPALKSALGVDMATVQRGFDASLDRTFGELRRALAGPQENALRSMTASALRGLAAERPGSYPVQMALGRALRASGDTEGAMAAFASATTLVPTARGDGSPHAEMASMSIEKKDTTRAMAELRALVAVDYDNLPAARRLWSLMRTARMNDPADLAPVSERIVALDPFNAEAHAVLGRAAMQANKPDVAAREFKVVLALKPIDAAGAHTDLAESYFRSGKSSDAKKEVLEALEIAPTYPRAQELLLELVGEQPQ
jgi:cellulose synthase operon protein C